jgi:RNA polymerase sigma-70 factor, ECF subfamily
LNIKTENSKTRKEFFKEFYEENFDLIYKFVFSRLSGNTEYAEDMVHDIFFEAMKSFNSFNNKSSFSTWLIGIAKHKIADYYKKASRAIACIRLDEDNAENSFKDEEGGIIAFHNYDQVLKALNKLNDSYKCFLVMKYIECYSLKEISKISGKTNKAVDGILQRAKNEFKKHYLRLQN